jgi:hypothetical protein
MDDEKTQPIIEIYDDYDAVKLARMQQYGPIENEPIAVIIDNR